MAILIVLIFLASLSCVHSQELNETNHKLDLNSDADDMTIASPIAKSNSSDENVLASTSVNNTKSQAYLILDNDADKENVYLGDYVTWIVSVLNKGPDTAENVKVIDQLPDGLEYVSHTATKGTFNPKSGIWDIGNLSVDEGEVFLNILTQAFCAGEKINKAKLTTDSDNLNENASYEEEEIDVFENPSISKSEHAPLQCVNALMKYSTANPIVLIVISLFGIFVCAFKKVVDE